MNKTPSYPFPPIQQGVNIHDIIYRPCRKGSGTPEPWARSVYERSIGEKARRWRLQYLTIEEELERAYRYVTPSADNANAHSFKFAEIIRSAAGAYERFCKTLHAEFYGDGHKLDIFNYLALKRFLKLAVRSAVPLLAAGDFPDHPEVTRPFVKLARWDMNSPIVSAHVPAWWDAYNSVKHDGISATSRRPWRTRRPVWRPSFSSSKPSTGSGYCRAGSGPSPAQWGLNSRVIPSQRGPDCSPRM